MANVMQFDEHCVEGSYGKSERVTLKMHDAVL